MYFTDNIPHPKLSVQYNSAKDLPGVSATKMKETLAVKEPSVANQCKICGLINFNAWSLTIHMRRHNNERPAKCCYCPASFVNTSELKTHMITHTKDKTFSCRFCSKGFTNNSSKALHEDTHKILEHKCKFCDQKFWSQVERRAHQKTHNRGAHACEFCCKKFANEEFLRRHKETDHEKSLNCLKCKLKFNSHEELKLHKAIHRTNRKNFISKKSNEVQYFQDADVKLSTYFFTCGVCSEKFSFRLDLAKHIELEHASSEKESIYKFKCTMCNKSFDSNLKLKGHMVGHGPRKHKCPHCNYSSTRGKDLAKHIEGKHSIGKNYQCSQCGLLFTHYYTFVYHKLKHGQKNFKCDMCDKAYYVKSRLSNHKRVVHYSGNPVCDQCGKIFRNILTLRAHQRNFHNRPVAKCVCNLCGMSVCSKKISKHHSQCMRRMCIEASTKLEGPLCTACNVTFSVHRDLFEHFKDMHPTSVYPCKFCHKEYLSPELIQRHLERKHIPSRPLLRKHKHIFTIEEKRSLKMDEEAFHGESQFECFACGMSFEYEALLNLHVDKDVCSIPKSVVEQLKNSKKGKQNFTLTKMYKCNSYSQVLENFHVQITPKSLKNEPLSIPVTTIPVIESPGRLKNGKKKLKKSARLWTPAIVDKTLTTNVDSPNHQLTSLPPVSDKTMKTAMPTIDPVQAAFSQVTTSDLAPDLEPPPSQGAVVSSTELLRLLQDKAVNVDGTSFISLNELFQHLKAVAKIEVSS